jgi:hypothetical protein
MFYEEYDYCERVKKAGFKIFYNGHSNILHKQSVSIGVDSPFKSYYMARNRVYFSRKNYSGLNKVSAVLYYSMVAFPKNVLKELIKGRYPNSIAIVRGSCWNIFNKVERV